MELRLDSKSIEGGEVIGNVRKETEDMDLRVSIVRAVVDHMKLLMVNM